MKRQKQFKGFKATSIFKGAKKFAMDKLATIFVIALFVLAIFFLSKAFLQKSDYFRLRSVEMRDSAVDQKTASYITGQLYNLYKGRNIFSINLRYAARSLEHAYPDAKEIFVRIALPDRLSVSMKFRKPVALIKSDKLYPVDEEAFIVTAADPNQSKDLPVIEGVDLRYDEKKGKRCGARSLKLALELLRNLKQSRFVMSYGILAIDAKDTSNLLYYIKSGVEMRMGAEKFRDRTRLLEKTLRDPRIAIDKIQYIDLRFEDAVIGPKE